MRLPPAITRWPRLLHILFGAAFLKKWPPGRPSNGHLADAPASRATYRIVRGGRYFSRTTSRTTPGSYRWPRLSFFLASGAAFAVVRGMTGHPARGSNGSRRRQPRGRIYSRRTVASPIPTLPSYEQSTMLECPELRRTPRTRNTNVVLCRALRLSVAYSARL